MSPETFPEKTYFLFFLKSKKNTKVQRDMQKRVVDGMKSTLLRLTNRTIADIYQNFSLHMYSSMNTKFYESQFFSNIGLY